jgi:hypothetical protein
MVHFRINIILGNAVMAPKYLAEALDLLFSWRIANLVGKY